MQDFKKLQVWKKSHELTLEVYNFTAKFPREERFGLIDQMRRSSASIPTNIAEGCGRGSNPDFIKFLNYSMGSASELEYQLLLAKDLNYLSTEAYSSLNPKVTEIKRMLAGFIRTLKSKKS